MNCPISLLYARAYVHATENMESVLKALESVARGRPVIKSVQGHHGNPIHIVEVRLEDCEALDALKSLLSRLDDVEFQLLLSGIDEGRLYAKFDKQRAYRGVLRVSHGDDVIHLEVRARTLLVPDLRQFLESLRAQEKR